MAVISAEKAYLGMIVRLNDIWDHMSTNIDTWAKEPGMNYSTALSPALRWINMHWEQIALDYMHAPTTARTIGLKIRNELEVFRDSMMQGSKTPFKNAADVTTTWLSLVKRVKALILSDVDGFTVKVDKALKEMAA